MNDNSNIEQFTEKLGATNALETRIDMATRNKIQVALMKVMLGEHPSVDDELAWATRYRRVVSDIMDDPANTDIRSAIGQIFEEATRRQAKTTPSDYLPVAMAILNHPLIQAEHASNLENAA